MDTKEISRAWHSVMVLNGDVQASGRRPPAPVVAQRGVAQRQLAAAIKAANLQARRTKPKRRVSDRELAQARQEMQDRALSRWGRLHPYQQRAHPELAALASEALARREAAR